MDPHMPEELRRHLQSVGEGATQAVLNAKMAQALELEDIEAQIRVAKARAEVAIAEAALCEHDQGKALSALELSPEECAFLQTRVNLARIVAEKYQAEVVALRARYEAKQKVAEASLGMDPTLMMRMMQGMTRLGGLDDAEGFGGGNLPPGDSTDGEPRDN